VKDDDGWLSQTLEKVWPPKRRGKPEAEPTEFLLQWGEIPVLSEIGKVLLQSFDTTSSCLRNDDFDEWLCHKLPGLKGASLYFVTGPDRRSLQPFSATLSFEDCNSAVVTFCGLVRAFTRFPDEYPPVAIVLQEEVDHIPAVVRDKLSKLKEKCNLEWESLALKYTRGAKRLE
jgi:hypothetical protein